MRTNLKTAAKKVAATISVLAIMLVGTSAALAQGNPSASIHASPLLYQDWKAQGYVFPAGFELYAFNWSEISDECRAEIAQMSISEQSKLHTCGEFTVSELLKKFDKVWANGGGYAYRIVPVK